MPNGNLKPGDVITLEAAPTVQCEQYALILKPSASVTRELGDDIPKDLEEMSQALRAALLRSAATQMGVVEDMVTAYDNGGKSGVIDYCMKELGLNGEDSIKRRTGGGVAATRKKRPPKR